MKGLLQVVLSEDRTIAPLQKERKLAINTDPTSQQIPNTTPIVLEKTGSLDMFLKLYNLKPFIFHLSSFNFVALTVFYKIVT